MNRSLCHAVLLASMLAGPAAFGLEASAPLPSSAGKDFIAEAKLLYRVVACSGKDPLPPHIAAQTVEEHCRGMSPKMDRYRSQWIGRAKEYISRLRPAGLPTTVVYPFGGGDLISVLTTYPDATDITTMSLEHAGDPRRLTSISKERLSESLGLFRRTIWGLLMADNSTTANLQRGQGSEIPGELGFFLVALAEHGYEPVSLKYFRLEQDGSIHYLTEAEIASMESTKARTLQGSWASPDLSVAFSNSELTFRPVGSEANGPLRVHRHLAANLANTGLDQAPGLVRYLESKGRIAAMTKAASYLLWRDDFSKTRDYLLAHMEVMISDSTGIPPKFLEQAGFTMETYGSFSRSFLGASAEYNKAFRALWSSQPRRQLPFRYGYLDGGSGAFHMFVAKKVAARQKEARRDTWMQEAAP